MVRHIIYLYNVGGSDIVALGSDYDGIDCDVEMKNFTEIYKLYDELRKHFSEDIIDKFFYKNGERIIKSEAIGTYDSKSNKEFYYQVEDNMV